MLHQLKTIAKKAHTSTRTHKRLAHTCVFIFTHTDTTRVRTCLLRPSCCADVRVALLRARRLHLLLFCLIIISSISPSLSLTIFEHM